MGAQGGLLLLSIRLPLLCANVLMRPCAYAPLRLCAYALKEMPQPQVLFAFGLLNTNPLLIRFVS
jgi:hypothetical protein